MIADWPSDTLVRAKGRTCDLSAVKTGPRPLKLTFQTAVHAMKFLPAIVFLALAASPARAEDCRIYPPGRERFACASAQHPGLLAKRERCKQEAEGAGSQRIMRGAQGVAFHDYVMRCMQRGH